MELRHLCYFLAIAHAEDIRLASEHLHVTQPALFRQLKDLEDELGIKLFERLPHCCCNRARRQQLELMPFRHQNDNNSALAFTGPTCHSALMTSALMALRF